MNDAWGRKTKEMPSVWLKLKSKDENARIRIAAPPLREINVWPADESAARKPMDAVTQNSLTEGMWMSLMRNPEWRVQEQFVILCIDRADGGAKIMRIAPSAYEKIQNLVNNPEWGDPTTYDITITRTESPGKAYWDIAPSPNKSLLTAAERGLIDKLDLAKLLPSALPANVPQPDDIDENTPPEPLPWEEQRLPARTATPVPITLAPQASAAPAEPAPAPYVDPGPAPGQKLDDVIEDIGDEPINLDDIPFDRGG